MAEWQTPVLACQCRIYAIIHRTKRYCYSIGCIDMHLWHRLKAKYRPAHQALLIGYQPICNDRNNVKSVKLQKPLRIVAVPTLAAYLARPSARKVDQAVCIFLDHHLLLLGYIVCRKQKTVEDSAYATCHDYSQGALAYAYVACTACCQTSLSSNSLPAVQVCQPSCMMYRRRQLFDSSLPPTNDISHVWGSGRRSAAEQLLAAANSSHNLPCCAAESLRRCKKSVNNCADCEDAKPMAVLRRTWLHTLYTTCSE